jgi:hypothetical protein
MLEKQEIDFDNKQLEIAKEKGIILKDEDVKAVVSLWKYSMTIFAFGLFARFLQKRYILVVTSRRVLLVRVPAFLVHGGGGAYFQHMAVERPCNMTMSDVPKQIHQIGNRVTLPSSFAVFVGRDCAFVVRGLAAQQAFSIASQGAEEKTSKG